MINPTILTVKSTHGQAPTQASVSAQAVEDRSMNYLMLEKREYGVLEFVAFYNATYYYKPILYKFQYGGTVFVTGINFHTKNSNFISFINLFDASTNQQKMVLHNTNYAAVIDNNGLSWYRYGVKHRSDGPAYIDNAYGDYTWYTNGVIHCDADIPAKQDKDYHGKIRIQYYKHGKLHRLNGPAVITDNSKFEWYFEGQLHRIGAPAVQSPASTSWHQIIDGKSVLHRTDGPAIIQYNGTMHWYQFGEKHRQYGPASICPQGKIVWYYRGEIKQTHENATFNVDTKITYHTITSPTNDILLHRTDGPAIEHPNGDCEWWQVIDGKSVLHRIDGPAISYHDTKYWFRNGLLHNTSGPAITDNVCGNYRHAWYYGGELHRSDGPAVIENYTKKWYYMGKLHRTDGPAVESFALGKRYYWHGKEMPKWKYYLMICFIVQ